MRLSSLYLGMSLIWLICGCRHNSLPDDSATLSDDSSPVPDSIDVVCQAPDGFAGNAAQISGRLTRSNQGNGLMNGSLKIFVGGSTQQPILDQQVTVKGQYNDYGKSITMVAENSNIDLIYLNFGSPNVSYIEVNGQQYLSTCVTSNVTGRSGNTVESENTESNSQAGDTIEVNCSGPSGFAGNTASISGTLALTPTDQGRIMATGDLNVLIGGSTRNTVFDKRVSVKGQFDDSAGTAYAQLGDTQGDLSVLYLNFDAENASYVEQNGKRYLSNCTDSQL